MRKRVVEYVQLLEDYRSFKAGDIFQVKFKTDDSVVVHIAYGHSTHIPRALLKGRKKDDSTKSNTIEETFGSKFPIN